LSETADIEREFESFENKFLFIIEQSSRTHRQTMTGKWCVLPPVVMVWSLLLLLILGSVVGYGVAYLLSFMTRSRDEPDERRKTFFKTQQKVVLPSSIDHSMGWAPNSRGMLLFRHQYIPTNTEIKGVIGLCHGFGDHSQDFLTDLAIKFCESGYAVLAMDAEGHGWVIFLLSITLSLPDSMYASVSR
jgi:hypothetical protein